MQTTIDAQVRSWLRGFPGRVTADTPEKCLAIAYAKFGGVVSAEDFAAALKAEGFLPEQIGARWQIRLPTKSINASRR